MRFEVTLPSRFAMDMWYGMKLVEAHKEEADSWIAVGDYYFKKITTE